MVCGTTLHRKQTQKEASTYIFSLKSHSVSQDRFNVIFTSFPLLVSEEAVDRGLELYWKTDPGKDTFLWILRKF